MDFTKEKIEELPIEAFSLFENFCLLENDIFTSGIKGKYSKLFEKPDCILQVNRYITNIKEAIKWSKEQPYDKCIVMLNFTYDKCEKDIKQYSKEFNATFNYLPTEEEIEEALPNRYIDDNYSDSQYEKDTEEAYDKVIKNYETTHQKELKGLSMLRKALFSVEKEIYIQECKQKFIKEALSYKDERKYNKPNILNFINISDKKKAESIIQQMLRNKKGKQIALSIIALIKTMYIRVNTRSSFYEAIRYHFGYDIGTDQSINKYLSKSTGKIKEKREYAFFSNQEIEEEIKILRSCKAVF